MMKNRNFGVYMSCAFSVLLMSATMAQDADDKQKKKAKKVQQVATAVAAVATVAKKADSKDEKKTGNAPMLKVSLSGLSDENIEKNAHAFLAIYEERDKPVENPSYTRYLADAGREQLALALQPFGYYQPNIKATLKEGNTTWSVSYHVDKGQPTRVNKREVTVKGQGRKNPDFTKLITQYPLKKGDILDQKKYTDFKNQLVEISTTDGYFDAKFTRKQIVLSDDFKTADIFLTYDTGSRYQFGKVEIKQDFLDQDVFDRYKTFEAGEVYSSKSLAELQRDLYNSGYVEVIDVTAKPENKDKNVPVELKITPKKNKKHTFSVGYGTDSGARGRYDFDWRWVNRRGHKLGTDFFISQKKIEAGAEYIIPGDRPAHDNYKFFGNYNQSLDGDVDSRLWNVGGAYRDKNGNLTREFGVKYQQEDFSVGKDSGNFGLLTPYVKFTYRKADDPLIPTEGILVETKVAGAHVDALSDVSMLHARAKAKYIKKFMKRHKFVLKGGAGRTWSEDFHRLPVAYRFFLGGDHTIRGYRYNAIGDRDSSGAVVGGDKHYFVGAEYEFFITDTMAIAAFVDAGDVYSEDAARLKVGAGVGFHYYSPIGPVKFDIAHGFHEPGDEVRLHLTIGPEL